MKKLQKLFAAILIAVSIAGYLPALASQGALVIPTAGTLSGLTAITDINAALDALATCNSGGSAPLNSSAAPSVGQFWCSTATSGYLILSQYDGTSWQEIGRQDTTNHLWVPPVGGGTATLASGSTVDLGSVPQAYINITGTTTITAFGSSAQPGTIRFVKFAGALTLTNNATSLILPNNGNNITTAAGDTAIAIYLGGGNWLVANYSPVNGAALQAQSVGSAALLASAQGMNAPLNLRINATVSGSALTVALKTAANADATSGPPILIPFRDPTLANGDPIIGSLQSALSFTVASTNTLGTQSGNIAFRLWVIAYYNGGTISVGLFNASSFTAGTGGQIYPLAEGGIVSTAASTNGGNSAGTHYANVSTITNTPYRILGYLEWSSGLTTAGTWASAPTSIVLFGPGIKKPGDVVQTVYGTFNSTTSINASNVATGITKSISPTSPVNVIRARSSIGYLQSGSNSNGTFNISRNSAGNVVGSSIQIAMSPAGQIIMAVSLFGTDAPNTTSSTTYTVYGSTSAGTNTMAGTQSLELQEIMG